MGFTARDKAAARAIVSIFETGRVAGNASAVAVLADGAGISYGMHQATDRSGSLAVVLNRYLLLGGKYSELFRGINFQTRTNYEIAYRASNGKLKESLRIAGTDPIMRQAQNEVFDRLYMEPAVRAAEGSGWIDPLSLAVVYDSKIHGSFERIRDRVDGKLPERLWITQYVAERKKWLGNHPTKIVRATVYRMNEIERLIRSSNWALTAPMVVRGVRIDEGDLG